MKLLSTFALLVLITGCGKSSDSPSTKVIPKQPSSTPGSVTVNSVRQSDGSVTSHPATLSQNVTLTIPLPSEIVIVNNAAEFYHITLNIGSAVCDYVHNAGTSNFVSGSGCSVAGSTVNLQSGDVVGITVGNYNQVNGTDVEVTYNWVTQ